MTSKLNVADNSLLLKSLFATVVTVSVAMLNTFFTKENLGRGEKVEGKMYFCLSCCPESTCQLKALIVVR